MNIVVLARHGKAVLVYIFIGHFHSYTGQAVLLLPNSLDRMIQLNLIGSCNRAFRPVQLLLLQMEPLLTTPSLIFGPCLIDGQSFFVNIRGSTENQAGW